MDSQQEVEAKPNAEPGVTSCPQWPPLCSLSLPSDWFQLFHVYPGQAELWSHQRSSAALPWGPGPAWSLHQLTCSLSFHLWILCTHLFLPRSHGFTVFSTGLCSTSLSLLSARHPTVKPTCRQGERQRQKQLPAWDKKKLRRPGESEQSQPVTPEQTSSRQ